MAVDPARKAADQTLKELDRRIASVYGAALADVKNQMNEFTATFEREDAKYRKRVENGSATEEQYRKWRRDQVMDSNRFKALVKSLSVDLTRHTEIAMALVNGELPEIYAEAMNYGTFEVEHGTTIETAFTLYDRSTVMGLLRDQPDLYPSAAVNRAKQQRWDRQHIVSAVTQGLLAGDPMDRIANRMERVVGMDAAVAARAARTCVTAAENSGRVDSYRRAENLGIKVKKQWLATLDGRTRSSHRALDGESVGVDEKFSNGLRYPGDPSGAGVERYNCRCTLVADLAEFPAEQVNRASKLGDMSYEEWRAEKERTAPGDREWVRGGNLMGDADFLRGLVRTDKDDVIEYVVTRQGYDGKPSVIGEDQLGDHALYRGVGGPDEDTVQGYHEDLLNGDWYYSNRYGTAMLGRGMYTTSKRSVAEGYGSGSGAQIVERMQLRDEARVLEADQSGTIPQELMQRVVEDNPEFFRVAREEYAKMYPRSDFNNPKVADEELMRDFARYYAADVFGNDLPSLAAAMGYDAVRYGTTDGTVVIVNRTALEVVGQ